jgi:hypothetical protein
MDRRWALRRVASLLAVLAVAGATTGIFATTASAAPAPPSQTDTITTVINGPAPAGTTFTVHVSCAPTGTVGDVTFNGAQTQGGPLLVSSPFIGACTYTETGTGGATSFSGSCTIDSGTASPGCSGGGSDPVVVTFSATSFDAAVTFTNTFVATTTTTTAPPAAPVVVGPRFTG